MVEPYSALRGGVTNEHRLGVCPVRPDTSQFRPELRRSVTAAVSSIVAKVEIGADFKPTGLKREVQQSLRCHGRGRPGAYRR